MVFARDEVLCSPASSIEVEDDRVLRGIDSDNHTASLGSTLEDKLLRLAEEKENELLAALMSGDQTTFEIFRCEAPELKQLPDATYEWYCKNYLDKYYPVRIMMKLHGIRFPVWRG